MQQQTNWSPTGHNRQTSNWYSLIKDFVTNDYGSSIFIIILQQEKDFLAHFQAEAIKTYTKKIPML
jgi:hypothetical protein